MLLESQSNAAKLNKDIKKLSKEVAEERNQIRELLLEKQRKTWIYKDKEHQKEEELTKEANKTKNKYTELTQLKNELQKIKTAKLKSSDNTEDKEKAKQLEEMEKQKKLAEAKIAQEMVEKRKKE